MTSSASFDALHFGLFALTAYFAALFLRERSKAAQSRLAVLDLEDALNKLKSETRQLEYRIERFDVVWFPTITVSDDSMEALRVLAGTPHCKKCVAPLSLSNDKKGWVCPQCSAAFPESLLDVTVMDAVNRTALQYFRERHKGYKLNPSLNV